MLSDIRPSAVVLLAVNSVPLFGVLLFGWSIFDVVFLYWAENVVIGAINVLRMAVASPQVDAAGGRAAQIQMAMRSAGSGLKFFMIPFFVVHYGMFCYGHQIFLVGLFGDERSLIEVLSDAVIWLGILAIAASHLYSFVTNFLIGGEYSRTDARLLMARPYGRIVVLHVTIIIGSFLYQAMGEPLLLLLVLIVVKTAVDLKQHSRERELFAAASASEGRP